eukprot:TRINITY_DN9697_c0_g1_i5.p1 TRINITY_DN9697_c0_g1~~TRINITY_DN9697_c0_g1_i5.p1  ORF type:complete len:330 (-),score=64.74 TRINITY_DN9697_c0_g1_i5:3-959(-)
MRARFTAPGTHICWYELEWNPSSVAWSAFRAEFIGATEPVQAEPGSLRGTILRQWVSLGLASEPSTGENGVHASASPLEGLAEKVNWLGVSLAQDPFGKLLINAGISEETIRSWTADPAVYFEGRKQSVFDLLEDLDVEACVDKARKIAAEAAFSDEHSSTEPTAREKAVGGLIDTKSDGMLGNKSADMDNAGATHASACNSAFLFIKPHAANDQVQRLVENELAARGIRIAGKGNIGAETIDRQGLIDGHYGAIASRAMHQKPQDLVVQQKALDDFRNLWHMSWEDALSVPSSLVPQSPCRRSLAPCVGQYCGNGSA